MGKRSSSVACGIVQLSALLVVPAGCADPSAPSDGPGAGGASTSVSTPNGGECKLGLAETENGCANCEVAFETGQSKLPYCTQACSKSADCPAGHVCVEGACLRFCDGFCPEGLSCLVGDGTGCQPDEDAHSSGCDPHIEDVATACAAPCEFPLPLGDRFYCTTALPCGDDGHPGSCPAGWECFFPVNGQSHCEITCQGECPEPWHCMSITCQP